MLIKVYKVIKMLAATAKIEDFIIKYHVLTIET